VPGAVQHSMNLRQIIFDVTRNMDISSMKDKVGALTNFGLRILFFDALNKLATKGNCTAGECARSTGDCCCSPTWNQWMQDYVEDPLPR